MYASDTDTALRTHLARLLDWEDAHPGAIAAFESLPANLRGVRPPGHAHSVWELLEHIRLAQRDILDFCRDPAYEAPSWPDDYWPIAPAPPSDEAWRESRAAMRDDTKALQALARDPDCHLFAPIPHGDGQTVLRELLLSADHTAYHIGQVVLLRRALDAWPA